MEYDKLKSGEPDFEGAASIRAWKYVDEEDKQFLIVEIGNSAGLGSTATLVLQERQDQQSKE